ncbi:MAG: winged helix-turn-helix transcriptional regulator [Candidatus Diapherotrites archaeon]|uniref:Winged helix-turn-helix transcriptional regulator n=1 Tax=Candidatus Iainarchaeum sp. TaxID=3101447 RepID=A0A8T4L6K1_9ARCH|nr:winged helix-turn-helix transcriptional regulator [Candidatus Diapherotrites archaeon]
MLRKRFEDNTLELETRNRLYRIIEESPGLHFRELQRRSGIAVGSLQYHLDYLSKKSFVHTVKEGKFVRYYAMKTTKIVENKELMNTLRQEQPRHIVLFLLQKRFATNEVISKAISLSPSTVSTYLKKMVEIGILGRKKTGAKTAFFILDKDKVAQMLSEYQGSFLDNLVDNFVTVWNEV